MRELGSSITFLRNADRWHESKLKKNKNIFCHHNSSYRIALPQRVNAWKNLEQVQASTASARINYHALIHFWWSYRQCLLWSNFHLKAWSGMISASYHSNRVRLEESIPGPPQDISFTVLILHKLSSAVKCYICWTWINMFISLLQYNTTADVK